ncbi:MAG: DUF177 domain-containing protein [Rhodothermales bacterium]
MIEIDIKALKPGLYDYEWSPEAEPLGLDPEVFRELHVEARVDFGPSRIFVTVHTRANAKLVCDRTLVEFDQFIEGRHQILFSSTTLVEDMDEQDDDVRELGAGDEEIDITDVVRDSFALSVPVRKVAPGADSEEIPLVFGVSDQEGPSIDPRWEALRKLSSQGDESGSEE